MTTSKNNSRCLSPSQISQLEAQGCYSEDWSRVKIDSASDISLIRGSRFYGDVVIGVIAKQNGRDIGIFNSVVRDCTIGSSPYINSVAGELRGLTIGNNVVIDTCYKIIMHPDARPGIGVSVAVLDEKGTRTVRIFPGMSSQAAMLMMLRPEWGAEIAEYALSRDFADISEYARIGDGAEICDCGEIIDVGISPGVRVSGASRLRNGLILRNAPEDSEGRYGFVGRGVDASGFIIENARVDSGVILRNCYVGEGCVLDKGLTMHDSLMFANCACENGEICASFAGPYTVTMHKSTLLIGGIYSFMNAGSNTNFSNHLYKLGPEQWGIMERGAKTSSGSYMMWGGKIGAFSLLIGAHKTHPDTSRFPFSYLIADSAGATHIVPGIMLRSCGMRRDGEKWPQRDVRKQCGMPCRDNISFDTFNPVTISAMQQGYDALTQALDSASPADTQLRVEGFKISRSAAQRGAKYYRLAILAYLAGKVGAEGFIKPGIETTEERWTDLGGQILPVAIVEKALTLKSLNDITNLFRTAHDDYADMERSWALSLAATHWHDCGEEAEHAQELLNHLADTDKELYEASLAEMNQHQSQF